MPQVPVNKEYNTFVRGLITEAGPLTFPENASLDEDNFELNTKGYRSRRLGLDYENSHSLRSTNDTTASYQDKAISVFKWEDVNNNGSLEILVVQVGLDLFFYDATKQPISGSPLNAGNPLTVEGDRSFIFQSAIISGRLVIVTGSNSAFQLVYNEQEDTVTYLEHGILVRDIWGVADEFPDDFRPSTSADDRYSRVYNLHNQGWGTLDPSQNLETSNVTFMSRFAVDYFNENGSVARYPSNIDKVTAGIDSTDLFRFKGELVLKNNTGKTLSPKGSFVIDLFERSASRLYAANKQDILNNYFASGSQWNETDVNGNKNLGVHSKASQLIPVIKSDSLTGTLPQDQLDLVSDRSTGGIRAIADYAGRIFYAGFGPTVGGDTKSPNLGIYVAYSQVVDNEENVGKCYQEGDPTSLNDFDLVASDGGTIKIPGAAFIQALIPFGQSLLVFATNGVWEIKGGEGGFSATDNTVDKLNNIGSISAQSIVVAENTIFYWSEGGIYTITRDQVGLSFTTENISRNSIQSFYADISSAGRETVTGVYSEIDKKIIWIYNDESTYTGLLDRYRFNRQLHLDTTLGSFYTYTFATDSSDTEYPRVSGIFVSPNFVSDTYEDQVVVGSDNVQVNTEDVVISISARSGSSSRVGYLTVKPSDAGSYQYTFAALNNPSFLDWNSDVSVAADAPGHVETGFEILNDTQRKKQNNYLTVHMERTEDGFDINLDPTNESSCFLQVKWDYANSSNSGKLGTPFQVYRFRRDYIPSGTGDSFDYGQSVITTKNKVRGRGRALTMRFSTEPGKNCILYGWGSTYAANTDV